ncbi:MAG: rhomboid family intramembrane serine protease [Solirubrobacteraceae bacterium]
MAVCYRHPSRETGVSCSSCGRPICPDCMTPTSVGMRCPECSRERTKVRTLRSTSSRYSVTEILIAINVVVFLAEVATGVTFGGSDSGWVYSHGALFGPALTGHNAYAGQLGAGAFGGTHEYWRLLTSGFLHEGLLHIAFNMFFLYFVGRMLEPAIGRANFLAIYLASLLAGSFGALLFQPDSPTLGASTACFGVLGALMMVAHARRISIWQSGLGPTLLINVVFTLTVSDISIGGHIGGLIGGFITGWFVVELDERRGRKRLALAGCALVGLISIVAGIAVAGGTGLTPNGLNL